MEKSCCSRMDSSRFDMDRSNEAVEKVPADVSKISSASVREYRSKNLVLLLLYSRRHAFFCANPDHFFGI